MKYASNGADGTPRHHGHHWLSYVIVYQRQRKDHVEVRSRGGQVLRQDVLRGREPLIFCLAHEGGDEFLLLLHQRVWREDMLFWSS